MMNDEQKGRLYGLIFDSLASMDSRFCFLSTFVYDNKEIPLEWKTQERPIAYEFYHQLRLRWDDKDFADIISECVLQAEVHKGYQNYPGLAFIPDFIIHRRNSSAPEDQLVVMEFKLATNPDTPKDIEKLAKFRNGHLRYQMAIEVLIGDQYSIKGCFEKISDMAKKAECEQTEIRVFGYNFVHSEVMEFPPVKYGVGKNT